MTTGARKTHDFCWINVMTPDAERAKEFFAKLFGWTYGEMPGVPGGTLIRVGEHGAGAVMELEACGMPPGTPPVIGVMVKVDDADATVAKVNALGGHADPAFDVLENGRMAMCKDPNGAVFGVWQPKKQVGFDVDGRAHGAPTWFETLTSDVAKAKAFYTALFGWKAVDQEAVPGMTYTTFELDGVPVAGAMALAPNMGDVPPHWGMNFAVDDADRAAKLAVEAGGAICLPVQGIPGVGRFALLKSPQGVSFHVLEWDKGTR